MVLGTNNWVEPRNLQNSCFFQKCPEQELSTPPLPVDAIIEEEYEDYQPSIRRNIDVKGGNTDINVSFWMSEKFKRIFLNDTNFRVPIIQLIM